MGIECLDTGYRKGRKGPLQSPITGGIAKFLAKENFREILKVRYIYLGFSQTKIIGN